jgi:SAM-dependent methyltransferase
VTCTESASVYDAIYSTPCHTLAVRKNYQAEAVRVYDIVRKTTGREARDQNLHDLSLLDVACGTGQHLQYFAPWFGHVEGVDVSEEMLAIASQRLPDVQFHCTDMRSLDISDPCHESRFDVVTCLFSAIGYMTTPVDLQGAILAMTQHLKPGGVLIIEPWLKPETFDPTRVFSADFVDEPDLKVARITRVERKGIITQVKMHYTAARHTGIVTFEEDHRLAMWSEGNFFNAFRHCRLEAKFDPTGISSNDRGVYIATN